MQEEELQPQTDLQEFFLRGKAELNLQHPLQETLAEPNLYLGAPQELLPELQDQQTEQPLQVDLKILR